VYLEQLRHIDLKLHELYSYIRRNYKKDEVVVAMISDHGNGFSVDDGEPIMSDQRINVPLMIYCDWNGEHICKEMIESIDYGHIMCRLSGITDGRLDHNDGSLPLVFGGAEEKQCIFSQSLFPERHYEAGIIAKDFKFYLSSQNLVNNDCTVDLENSGYILVNRKNERFSDSELAAECLAVVQSMLDTYEL
jgi:hypothetical protein